MQLPQGVEAQVRPRSGLAANHGVTILNSPGTIDTGYRGELCIILINHGRSEFHVEPGMRIAQIIFAQTLEVTIQVTEEPLADSDRGDRGFGSSG
jgi:dUTP pyrophosphatase